MKCTKLLEVRDKSKRRQTGGLECMRAPGWQASRRLGKCFRFIQVFGLNFVMLGKVLKNPLDCLCNLSPLRKGIIKQEQQSQTKLGKGEGDGEN